MKCNICGKEIKEGSLCKECFKKREEYLKYQKEKNDHLKKKIVPSNNYCECGEQLDQTWNYCPKCKRALKDNLIVDNNGNIENAEEKNRATIYLVIYVVSAVLGFIFDEGFLFLISLIVIITGKINCPKSRAINILFWVTLFIIVLYVILVMWLIVTCTSAISSCPG